jgi:hypothetical protein
MDPGLSTFAALRRSTRQLTRETSAQIAKTQRRVPPISICYSGCSKLMKELEIEKRHIATSALALKRALLFAASISDHWHYRACMSRGPGTGGIPAVQIRRSYHRVTPAAALD